MNVRLGEYGFSALDNILASLSGRNDEVVVYVDH
jgi:hypothetical protein